MITLKTLIPALLTISICRAASSKTSEVKTSTSSVSKDKNGSDEKLDTASQSLFGYNNNNGGLSSGAYPGSSTSGLGGFGVSGGGSSGGIYPNQYSNGLGGFPGGSTYSSGGFGGTQGLSGFGGGGSFGGSGYNGYTGGGQFYPGSGFSGNNYYLGQSGLFGSGGGFSGTPFSQGFGGFNSYPSQFGGYNNLQFQGQQTDRNLGYMNSGFANPQFYNRSPSVSNIQPGLGSLQVGNRLDVNGGGGVNSGGSRGINYLPSGGSGGYTNTPGLSSSQFGGGGFSGLGGSNGFGSGGLGGGGGSFGGQQFSPSTPYAFNGPFASSPFSITRPGGPIQGGGYRPSPFISSQYDYPLSGGGIGLRSPGLGGGAQTGGPISSSPSSSFPPRLGEGRGRGLQTTGPNRFYQGTNPSGAFGRGGRLQSFTSSSDESDN